MTPDEIEAKDPEETPLNEEDQRMAKLLTGWRDKILHKAAIGVENHFLDKPVDDMTDEENGFERGLSTAVDEICKLMADPPSYFGRTPQISED